MRHGKWPIQGTRTKLYQQPVLGNHLSGDGHLVPFHPPSFAHISHPRAFLQDVQFIKFFCSLQRYGPALNAKLIHPDPFTSPPTAIRDEPPIPPEFCGLSSALREAWPACGIRATGPRTPDSTAPQWPVPKT
ncbi:uncharacterized protein PADG_12419 [Paracoccidioides brasiliensis Pb18]|uniref:Uncharacterized protein n=1 Tax=Paracoccidioides brasiliensis (strain Pb18) TaxID=502780 RepID=A0A0A0HS47_PARBD|nr:uncharacterized protein PADG_12419 [Paracoccidioides brasiliensis Pb18]KGM91487.1 hypothetical protein PADG_12419 [Paracoccidioides brasiliensis Pb18]